MAVLMAERIGTDVGCLQERMPDRQGGAHQGAAAFAFRSHERGQDTRQFVKLTTCRRVAGCTALVRPCDNDRGGRVAEQDTGGPIGIVDDLAERLAADDQDGTHIRILQIAGNQVQRIDEAGAGRVDVVTEGVGRAQAGLDHASG